MSIYITVLMYYVYKVSVYKVSHGLSTKSVYKCGAVASVAMAAAGGPRSCQLGRYHGWTAHGRGDRHGSRGGQLGRL